MTQQKLRIMIADDQELIRESLSIILSQNADMEVTGLAENGAELLSLIKKAPPDIVLMDIRMPVMDGVTAVKAIRDPDRFGEKSAIPIIAMTAHALVGDRERFLAAGLDVVMSTPTATPAARLCVASVTATVASITALDRRGCRTSWRSEPQSKVAAETITMMATSAIIGTCATQGLSSTMRTSRNRPANSVAPASLLGIRPNMSPCGAAMISQRRSATSMDSA